MQYWQFGEVCAGVSRTSGGRGSATDDPGCLTSSGCGSPPGPNLMEQPPSAILLVTGRTADLLVRRYAIVDHRSRVDPQRLVPKTEKAPPAIVEPPGRNGPVGQT